MGAQRLIVSSRLTAGSVLRLISARGLVEWRRFHRPDARSRRLQLRVSVQTTRLTRTQSIPESPRNAWRSSARFPSGRPDRPSEAARGAAARTAPRRSARRSQPISVIDRRDETRLLELFPSLEAIRHARRHLRRWNREEPRRPPCGSCRAVAHSDPASGVVGIIAPWNYPVLLAMSPMAAALAAGNRVLLKPSEFVAANFRVLAEPTARRFAADEVDVVTGGSTLPARSPRSASIMSCLRDRPGRARSHAAAAEH